MTGKPASTAAESHPDGAGEARLPAPATAELQACPACAMTVTFGCRCGEGDCPICGDPRAHVEDMALREEMAAWHEDESPQAVTYQEAILDGADPTEGFYE